MDESEVQQQHTEHMQYVAFADNDGPDPDVVIWVIRFPTELKSSSKEHEREHEEDGGDARHAMASWEVACVHVSRHVEDDGGGAVAMDENAAKRHVVRNRAFS